MIDLRSDTLTKPSEAMRARMAAAPVGDDVYGEDPTVNALEAAAAGLFGMEAALFVPSGTMANQIAVKTHTVPGDEIIVGRDSHVFLSEAGAAAVISSVSMNLISSEKGLVCPGDVTAALRSPDIHHPHTRLVWIENTHNRGGSTVYPLSLVGKIAQVAHGAGLSLHMDGARIFNASVASGTPVADYAAHCDTLTFCLSKGLGCPVGSMVAGSQSVITQARRWRKALGGGMRQAGIIAAAGLFALEHNIDRLAEDHANARLIAEILSGHPMASIDPAQVETNLAMLGLDERIKPSELVERARAEGVLFLEFGPQRVRLATHLDISRDDALRAAEVIGKILDTMT